MKNKKIIVKHPLWLVMIFEFVLLFGGGTAMLHLDRVFNIPNYVNVIMGVSLVGVSLIGLVLSIKFYKKILKREEKTKLDKIKKYAYKNKTFVLIQKRNIPANLTFLLGGICVLVAWLVFLPISPFIGVGYWIFRAVSVVAFVLGAIFSFVTPRKMLIYRNGKLHINTKEIQKEILPSELVDYKKNPSYPKDKNAVRRILYGDVLLVLTDGEVLLRKADCDFFLKQIIKTVKKIELSSVDNHLSMKYNFLKE